MQIHIAIFVIDSKKKNNTEQRLKQTKQEKQIVFFFNSNCGNKNEQYLKPNLLWMVLGELNIIIEISIDFLRLK